MMLGKQENKQKNIYTYTYFSLKYFSKMPLSLRYYKSSLNGTIKAYLNIPCPELFILLGSDSLEEKCKYKFSEV